MASTEGGVNIEDVAHTKPEKIVSFSVDPATGIMGHHGRKVAKALGLSGDLAKQVEKLVAQLYAAFIAKDMAMLEINPLVVTKQGMCACSMPRCRSMTTRCFAIRKCGVARRD